MKRLIFLSFISAACIFCFISFSDLKKSSNESPLSRDIVLQFITYNGYGNNLYIDNVLTGKQKDYDVMVNSVVNIPYDTSYAFFQNGSDTISPQVSVTNIGRLPADSVRVYFAVNFPEYIDSVMIELLLSTETQIVTFKELKNIPGKPLNIRAFATFGLDSNNINDVFSQYSIILPGFKRNVLFEEFTSNASPACANNNIPLNLFVNRNIESVCAIKYHLPLGSTGVDSFYLQNPVQNDIRWRYYFNQSLPATFADGKIRVNIPYGDSANLYNPYYQRLNKGTPVNITVQDEQINGDSIKANISINIASTLSPGDYRLRINAVERYVQSTGSNGETNFFDVFRKFYPDSNGIHIPREAGKYEYTYTYYREPSWNDTMIYTSVFIQDEDTKEILNSGKSWNENSRKFIYGNTGSYGIQERSSILNTIPGKREVLISSDSIQTPLNIELFEAYFPPLGWKVYNQDGFITFSQYSGVNGPTFGGTKCVTMNFFAYNFPGQKDSMISRSYSGLLESDTLSFDYAYAQFSSVGYIDSLVVKISTDGGVTFPSEIFRKGGLNLATAPQTSSFFFPTNLTQWRTFRFPLSNYVGVNNSSINLPDKFILNQNFPNPFNPSTTINYTLPVSDVVSLKVYDLLGKETAVLVNEKKSAGSYSVTFNAGSLPSGVYFYILKTTGFTDTKRMILIK